MYEPVFTVIDILKLNSIENIMLEYVDASLNEEQCGLIIDRKGAYEFVPCINLSENKKHNFKISPTIMSNYSDKLVSIFHTHIDNGTPAVTVSDLKLCEAWNIPGTISFIKNGRPGKVLQYSTSLIRRTLEKRDYYYNIFDCFTLIRDYYYVNKNVLLPFVYSDYGWWGTHDYAEGYYLTQYEKLGFYEIDIRGEIQEGDVLVMKLGRSNCLNHGAIYLGNNCILHHLEGRISLKESLGKYANRIERGFRHLGIKCDDKVVVV